MINLIILIVQWSLYLQFAHFIIGLNKEYTYSIAFILLFYINHRLDVIKPKNFRDTDHKSDHKVLKPEHKLYFSQSSK